MMDDHSTGGPAEPITTVTGGNKPLHRFLRGEPKTIGIVLVIMGICLIMFGIPVHMTWDSPSDTLTPLWLGILFITCGILYIMSENNPTKKIITASFAVSIVSAIGVLVAGINASIDLQHSQWFSEWNNTENGYYGSQHYFSVTVMERVFLFHTLIGGVLIVTMMFFARAALRSSRTRAVVVLRNLLSVE
ncbi:membrane-spanning 4-domains subfamily A member 15-like isoform X1 [Misgurnus anguillicaudatus]|uniref:membrane-spanning 4-domains subfamily A member 15-like isoform X1 n=1 Tax=Misgurnus anguillicaudatus TaxID=75329 RepID=UPI003CCFB8EA